MPSGSKSKTPAEKFPIDPPPYSLTGAGAADIAANYTRANALAAKSHAPSCRNPSTSEGLSVLTPRSGTDIVALIFILLSIPQSLSCLILTAYVLSNSFKNLAGKFVARCLIRFESGQNYSFGPIARSRYYRSELISEFLQLFSINSFILLVCHYTMPNSWLQYLILLAKSIIASRLIGSHSSGSNTYVSVVSSSSANPDIMITTTTMCNVDNTQECQSNDFFARGFKKFLQGTLFVFATKFCLRSWLSSANIATAVDHFLSFHRKIIFFQDAPKFSAADLVKSAIANSPVSIQSLSAKQSDIAIAGNSKVLEKMAISFATKHLHLGRNALGTIFFVIKEVTIVINYAYLVLCIHVISLTISPFLKKIFILRNYSNTLDHLSSLSPEIPYGGFKRNVDILPSLSEKSADAPVVLKLKPASSNLPAMPSEETPELKINHEISSAKMNVHDSMSSVSVDNFKIFCMSSSANLPISSGVKPRPKTTVDRKSASTNITPSTTIMDKVYFVSIQPLWSWLAAIKIIFDKPSFFSKPGSEIISPSNSTAVKVPMAVARLDEHSVVFEALEQSSINADPETISVKVNEVDWPYFEFVQSSGGHGNNSIRIYALSPQREFIINILKSGSLLCTHLVTTPGMKPEVLNDSVGNPVGTLQSSLIYAIQFSANLKAEFKKQRKYDSKRLTDLRKKVDILKSKIGKYGNKETSEVKVSGKLEDLQRSVNRLEAEIKGIEDLIHEYEMSETTCESERLKKEKGLEEEIEVMESSIKKTETELIRSRAELKSMDSEIYFTEMKLKKLTAKLKDKEEELSQAMNKMKASKKALLSKVQKRQAKVRERFNIIIPRISEATNILSEEIKAFIDADLVNQSF